MAPTFQNSQPAGLLILTGKKEPVQSFDLETVCTDTDIQSHYYKRSVKMTLKLHTKNFENCKSLKTTLKKETKCQIFTIASLYVNVKQNVLFLSFFLTRSFKTTLQKSLKVTLKSNTENYENCKSLKTTLKKKLNVRFLQLHPYT